MRSSAIIRRILTGSIFAGLSVGSAHAQGTPPLAPCSAAEYRALDFWVGDWDLNWTSAAGRPGTGHNHITRDELGDCAVVEHFVADGAGVLRGMSMSTYVPATREWRQTWVDARGGFFELSGGPVAGQDHVFELEAARRPDQRTRQRMIWQDVTADSLTWRWQMKADDVSSWTDAWVIHYRRRKP